jgi:hypothetical protein
MLGKSILLGSAASILMLGTPAVAQQQTSQQQQPTSQQQTSEAAPVNDEELRSFVSAFQTIKSIQSDAVQKMRQEIKDRGLSLNRYRQYLQQQQGNSNSNMSLSQEEKQKFQQATNRIQQIEQETQNKIQQAVRDEGLEINRFQQIQNAVRQDKELRQKAMQIMRNSQPQQNPAGANSNSNSR